MMSTGNLFSGHVSHFENKGLGKKTVFKNKKLSNNCLESCNWIDTFSCTKCLEVKGGNGLNYKANSML